MSERPEYRFIETTQDDGSILLEWRVGDSAWDALNFWYVPPEIDIEAAKERVRSGEVV